MPRPCPKTSLAGLIMVAALILGACGSGVTAPPGAAGSSSELTGAGATFPAPLYQNWADVYNKSTGVKINYQAIGSGGGIAQITAKTVDFGASDAPMKDEELAAAPGPILHIPTVFGAVVVTYNLPGVTGKLRLTGSTLADIFRGVITKWDDVAIARDNTEVRLPATMINVVHRSDGSGTTAIFTNFLSAANSAWEAKIGAGKEVEWPAGQGGKGNDGVAAIVQQVPGSIGYVELAYASKNNLAAASIKNRSGRFIAAALSTIAAAANGARVPADLRFSVLDAPGPDAYPLASATWLLVYQHQADAKKGAALAKFLWWAIHDGQQLTSSLLYAPLPANLVTATEGKIRSIDAGGTPLFTG